MKLWDFSAKPKAMDLRMISRPRKAYETNSSVVHSDASSDTG